MPTLNSSWEPASLALACRPSTLETMTSSVPQTGATSVASPHHHDMSHLTPEHTPVMQPVSHPYARNNELVVTEPPIKPHGESTLNAGASSTQHSSVKHKAQHVSVALHRFWRRLCNCGDDAETEGVQHDHRLASRKPASGLSAPSYPLIYSSHPSSREQTLQNMAHNDNALELQLYPSQSLDTNSPRDRHDTTLAERISGRANYQSSFPTHTYVNRLGTSPPGPPPFELSAYQMLPSSTLGVPPDLFDDHDEENHAETIDMRSTVPNIIEQTPGNETHVTNPTLYSGSSSAADRADSEFPHFPLANASESIFARPGTGEQRLEAQQGNRSSATFDSLTSVGSIYSIQSGDRKPLSYDSAQGSGAWRGDSSISPAQSRMSSQMGQSPFFDDLLSRFPQMGLAGASNKLMVGHEVRACTPHPPGFMAPSTDDHVQEHVKDDEGDETQTAALTAARASDTPPRRLHNQLADAPFQVRLRRNSNDSFHSPASSTTLSTLYTPSPPEALHLPHVTHKRRAFLQASQGSVADQRSFSQNSADGLPGLLCRPKNDDIETTTLSVWQKYFDSFHPAKQTDSFRRSVDEELRGAGGGDRDSITSAASGSYHSTQTYRHNRDGFDAESVEASGCGEMTFDGYDEGGTKRDRQQENASTVVEHQNDHAVRSLGRSSANALLPPNIPLPPVPAASPEQHHHDTGSGGKDHRGNIKSTNNIVRLRTKSSLSQRTVMATRHKAGRPTSTHSARSSRTVRSLQAQRALAATTHHSSGPAEVV